MRKILFLVIIVILSNCVAGQMLTQENYTSVNVISVLESLNKTAQFGEKTVMNLSEKNRLCELKYECRPHEDYFYYNCYFDENISNCRCFVGLFSKCRLELSNLSIIAQPTIRDRFRLDYIKDRMRPLKPLFSSAKGILYNWRTYVLGVLLALIVLILFYAYNRDTPANNLRKAVSCHKKAQKLYEKGKQKNAEKYYKLSEEYRKKVKEI